MTREFGYGWRRVWMVAAMLPVMGAFIVWREGALERPDLIILILVGIVALGFSALSICRVRLHDSEIEVSFLLPFRRGGRFRHEDIQHYSEVPLTVRGKKLPVHGILQPAGQAGIMIMPQGTRDFHELNSRLLVLYPRPEKPADP